MSSELSFKDLIQQEIQESQKKEEQLNNVKLEDEGMGISNEREQLLYVIQKEKTNIVNEIVDIVSAQEVLIKSILDNAADKNIYNFNTNALGVLKTIKLPKEYKVEKFDGLDATFISSNPKDLITITLKKLIEQMKDKQNIKIPVTRVCNISLPIENQKGKIVKADIEIETLICTKNLLQGILDLSFVDKITVVKDNETEKLFCKVYINKETYDILNQRNSLW